MLSLIICESVLDKLLTPPPFLARPMRESYRPDKFRFSRNFEQDHDQVLIKPGSTPVPKRNRGTCPEIWW